MDDEDNRLKTLRHARIRRVKQLLRWLPRRTNLEKYPVLKSFARSARKRPYLWSFRVANAAPAFYAGSILAFLPLYGVQIGLALVAALLFRANLPIMVGLQFVSNPLTMPFIYLINFFVGRQVVLFFSFGNAPGIWGNWFFSLMVGGFLIGFTVGATLDLVYRVAARQAAAQYVRIETQRDRVRNKPGAGKESR